MDGELYPLLDVELLELSDEVLETRCCGCRGSGEVRWAAWVCSWSRRVASDEADMNSCGAGRKASSGLAGSEGVYASYSDTGLDEGVSTEKWAVGTMLK